uniref:Uncharacterized protein n=1 Tax=Romanomermis culicivorax TaxID=13658 RepID=A0A915IE92_ROMCU
MLIILSLSCLILLDGFSGYTLRYSIFHKIARIPDHPMISIDNGNFDHRYKQIKIKRYFWQPLSFMNEEDLLDG